MSMQRQTESYRGSTHEHDGLTYQCSPCGDTCPVFPGKRYLDWQLDDPAGQDVAAVRPIRDDIDRRVRTLLSELLDN
jgi:protein-tyrosine-phosphatase